MMEADPTVRAFRDIAFEGSGRRGSPRIGWKVQLNKELILREECIVDVVRIFDVVNRKAIGFRLLRKPDLCGIDKRFVNTPVLGYCDHPKRAGRRPGGFARYECGACEHA